MLRGQAWHVGAWSLVSARPLPMPAVQPWSLGSRKVLQNAPVRSTAPPLLQGCVPGLRVVSLSLSPLPPWAVSALRAVVWVLGGDSSPAPSGRPVTAGTCSHPSPLRWSPATDSPATFLTVRTGQGGCTPPPHPRTGCLFSVHLLPGAFPWPAAFLHLWPLPPLLLPDPSTAYWEPPTPPACCPPRHLHLSFLALRGSPTAS